MDTHTQQSAGVEVILDCDNSKAPSCAHGPTLLFQRTTNDGKTGSRYYSCSACRDRKECAFFQWQVNGKMPSVEHPSPLQRDQLSNKLEFFRSLPVDQRRLCTSCCELLTPTDDLRHQHDAHSSCVKSRVKLTTLRQPSLLLPSLDNNKTNAQYLFSEESINMTLELIEAGNYDTVLCIGAPRIHEAIIMKRKSQADYKVKSLLMDIDSRFATFHPVNRYVHYNLFNHHFFEGASGAASYARHIASAAYTPPTTTTTATPPPAVPRPTNGAEVKSRPRIAIIIDPPFGGYVTVIAHTLKKIYADCDKAGKDAVCIWFFPYFLEKWITKALPSFKMLHYKVNYDNHRIYKGTSKRGSPVRIFTDIPSSSVIKPGDDFKLCDICQTYVPVKVKHCEKCNACICKDGRAYKHCDSCERCVKPSYRHCDKCNVCHLQGPCPSTKIGCHICKSTDHKRRDCPVRHNQNRKNANKRIAGKGSGIKPKFSAKRKKVVKKSKKKQ